MKKVLLKAWRRAGKPKNKRRNKETLWLPPRQPAKPSECLAIVCIVKDEAIYLREWIEFQRLMGAAQVYIYDNGSTDGTADVLAPFVAEGFVTVIPWVTFDRDGSSQRQAYAHALCNAGSRYRWMAFIDVDEFLFPLHESNLPSVLSRYEDRRCLRVPWRLFGFSGHDSPPHGLVIENYTHCAPPTPKRDERIDWKSVVKPGLVEAVESAHTFLTEGETVKPNGKITSVLRKKPLDDADLRINHYYTRSRQEFDVKLARTTTACASLPDKIRAKRLKRMQMIEADTSYDDAILRFVPILRERACAAVAKK